ncbi:MAG: hypothetical protein ACLUDU_01070 [Butyricimonas faecihominis]
MEYARWGTITLGDYHRNSNVGELLMPIALLAEVDYNALDVVSGWGQI